MKTELLSPAGSLKTCAMHLPMVQMPYMQDNHVIAYVRNNAFDHENLKIGIDEAHALGKSFMLW